ncbi:BAH domain, partial [Striga asiatica]
MDTNAHDIQICLCKGLNFLSRTCFEFALRHPYISLSTLCLSLVYIAFPLIFWVLVYSFPLIVCTGIILGTSFNIRRSKTCKNERDPQTEPSSEDDSSSSKTNRKPVSRVHSVRRRRAKEFKENKAVSSTNNSDMVDKNALTVENIPKDIREVEVVDYSLGNTTANSSCSASESSKHDFDENNDDNFSNNNNYNNNTINSNNIIKAIMQDNEPEDDRQKNKMDVVISDSERTKRLESLIARRRSRKLLSLEVRRTLMKKDRGDHHHHISSIIIPKSGSGGRFLVAGNNPPSPGSAPSVLIPIRNPFDLPYDPQEEKPDLTGDGFEQEFMPGNGRDTMFCRHGSFSSGALLPGEMSAREVSSSLPDSRFVQRIFSSLGCRQFIGPGGREFDREFTPILEHEPYEPPESEVTFHTPHGDHIKEVIQVNENNGDETQTQPSQEEQNTIGPRSLSPSSPSSDEDAPIFRIDRDAILKSLSSMARRNNSPLDKNTEQREDHLGSDLRDRLYYSDRIARRHMASNSIASDLQVEVSELSSPPLTIDENLSYPDFDTDSWAGSSLLDLSLADDYEPGRVEFSERNEALEDPEEIQCGHPWCAIAEFPDSCRTTRSMNLEDKLDKTLQRSFSQLAQASTPCKAKKHEEHFDALKETDELKTEDEIFGNANERHETGDLGEESANLSGDSEDMLEAEHLEMIMSSPIQPELTQTTEASVNRSDQGTNIYESLPSLVPNHVAFGFVQSSLPSPKSVLHPTCSVSSFDHYLDEDIHQTPIAPQNSTTFTGQSAALPDFDGRSEVIEVLSEPLNTHITEEADSGRSSIDSSREAHTEPLQETSPSSINDGDEQSSKNVLIAQSTDQPHEQNPPVSTEEELNERKEIINGEATKGDTNEVAHADLHEEQGPNEHNLSKPNDQKGQENSTSHSIGTKDEIVNFATNDSTIFQHSGPIEDNFTSTSYEKNEEQAEAAHIQTSDESLPVPEGEQHTNAILTEEKSKITQSERYTSPRTYSQQIIAIFKSTELECCSCKD